MKKKIYTLMMLIFLAIFLVSAFMLLRYFLDSRKAAKGYDEIRAIVGEEPDAFAKLKGDNEDFVGWLKIDDTTIDYPVVQSKSEPEFYLYRNFYKEDSAHGTLFVDAACDVDVSDNTIIHGHHMKDGSMFRPLEHYSDLDFYNSHKTIHFDTLQAQGVYEVFAVFRTPATEAGFHYLDFIQAATPEEYDAFVAQCKAIAEFDTGITPEYGQKLLTLSTCEYTQEEGRLVVMARKLSSEQINP